MNENLRNASFKQQYRAEMMFSYHPYILCHISNHALFWKVLKVLFAELNDGEKRHSKIVVASITQFAGGSTKCFGTYHTEVTKPKKI